MEKLIEVSCLMRPTVESEKKILIHRGGTRSGKSTTLLQMIIHWLITGYIGDVCDEQGVFSILRKYKASHKASTIRDFELLLYKYELYDAIKVSKQDSTYTFGNRVVEFIGADDPQKLRSATRLHLWCEEGNELNYEDFFQAFIRTIGRVFISFNPDDENTWIKTNLEDARMKEKKDVEVIISTYEDNPFLSKEIRENIEYLKETNYEYWQIYGLGEYAKLAGKIYDNYSIVAGIPQQAEFIGYGLDFGWTNPTALVRLYKNKDFVYVDEVIYQSQLSNRELSQKMKELGVLDSIPIIGDSEDPKSLEELKNMGWNIIPASKGKDSVIFGIKLLNSYNLCVTEQSTNIIKEINSYSFKVDKNNNKLQEPIKLNDHAMDAMRYISIHALSAKNDKNKSVPVKEQYKQLITNKTNNKAYK